MTKLIFFILLMQAGRAFAQTSDSLKSPFEGMDLSWINGQNRQTDFPLVLRDKHEETLLTGVVYLDTYFNYDFNDPADNTHTISSTIGRHREFTVNLASIGVESNYKNIIGRLWLQFGQMISIVQDLDPTVSRGRNTSLYNLRYVRDAAAGYHFNQWYGINVEMGIFTSYIGLESYVTQENWCYQRSMVSEFTPFYFSGARVQAFPSRNFRTELWLLNGWQSYNSWNNTPGVGNSNYWRPNENIQLAANFYLGKDSKRDVLRFHHDNSIVARYIARNAKNGLSQGAFSLNTHYGFQDGAGVAPRTSYMTGLALANRLWFIKSKLALSLRGDVVFNPGIYLAYSPSPVSPNAFTSAMAADPEQKLAIYQGTSTIDVMPNDYVTFRLEYGYRKSNVPYFAGRGGTTSPDGWVNTPLGNWQPDLVKSSHRVTFALSVRL
ncbi:MAG: hypothetical protein K0R82_2008 [Flavipsychrobacter sp.]|jgi:hypothetical protein|nr:hypothetical protein [Flavipsychrobacter sp.]